MKNYPQILSDIDVRFETALINFKADPLFCQKTQIYTLEDKERIAHLWKDIVIPFVSVRRMIRTLYWRSFFTFGSKNTFVVKYALVTTYYNMLAELRSLFGIHEEFLRQYLDDTFQDNYSTLAREVYHIRFYAILSYPHEFFLQLHDQVDPSLAPLFDRPHPRSSDIRYRWTHDFSNIYYYFRYRLSLILSWISQRGGRMMAHWHFSRRTHGLIDPNHLAILVGRMQVGDIILTRQNWAATNINIPGFWKHMAMYLGTGKSLSENPEIQQLLPKDLREDMHYIIEAIGSGVRVVPIELLAGHNDYFAVLRPQVSLKKVDQAVREVLSQIGKEYDYSFNYYSDTRAVCTSLVTKAYLPSQQSAEGLHIELIRVGTGLTYPPNNFAKKYALELDQKNRELEFVGYIDAREKTMTSLMGSEDDFIASASRSRLSFFLP